MSSSIILGKRKRKAAAKVEPEPDAAEVEDAQAIFRRHFEAQFAPIQDAKKKSKQSAGSGKKTATGLEADDDGADEVEDMRSDSESDDDAWDGLSEEDDSEGMFSCVPLDWLAITDSHVSTDDDDSEEATDDDSETGPTTVQVIDHSKPLPSSALPPQLATMSKRELRVYLSSRPPDTTATEPSSKTNKQKPGEKDDPQNEDSKTLLANDLELQRLINESHILAASNPFNSIGSRSASSTGDGTTGGKTFMQGRTRTLTTDLRLQQLGSKTSILTQRKMPMGMRQGINAAKGAREEKRRREARENGIILERENKSGVGGGGGKKSKRRGGDSMAVDMPGMGRFKNGELKLSKREVQAVEMEGKRMDFGGKRRRRRR